MQTIDGKRMPARIEAECEIPLPYSLQPITWYCDGCGEGIIYKMGGTAPRWCPNCEENHARIRSAVVAAKRRAKKAVPSPPPEKPDELEMIRRSEEKYRHVKRIIGKPLGPIDVKWVCCRCGRPMDGPECPCGRSPFYTPKEEWETTNE